MRNRNGYAALLLVGWLAGASGCGVVGVSCEGLTALFCGEGLYCRFEEGSCGGDSQAGVCTERPEVCTEIYAPVCGCDGQTYGNECQAAGAGVSVRSQGICPANGQSVCGGLAGFACDDGEFCKFPTGTCGAADQTGVCTVVPDVCTDVLQLVCGCDGNTYTNECESERAQTSVLDSGSCRTDDPSDEQICGGIAGFPCDEGEFCLLPEGQCCCDFLGVCTPLPEICTEEFAPVCGCDGVTYDNACFAQRVGVSIDHDGECAP